MSESPTAEVAEPSEPSIWQYRLLQDCALPTAPAVERLKKGMLTSLWGQWTSRRQPAPETPELNPIADLQIKRIAPQPAAADKLEALQQALSDWADGGCQRSPTAVLIQAPFGDESEVASLWAESREWELIQAQRDDYGEAAFAAMEIAEAPLVVTQVHKGFVRGVDGFRRFERLLLARERSGQPVLLVVDQWCWNLLRTVLPFVCHWPQWALQPLDAEALEHWLKQLMSGAYRQQRFLQASNQRPLFSQDLQPGEEQSRYLQLLAADSRGDPAVILARWRGALRQTLSNDNSNDSSDDKQDNKQKNDEAEVEGIWVQAWPNPDWPSQNGRVRDELVLLYGVIQHGGIALDDLPSVCSSSPSEVMSILRSLQSRNILHCEEGVCRLNPLAYPVVRKMLLSESFLCDGES